MHQRSVSHKHHASLVNLVYKKRLFFTYSSETILHNMSKTRSHLDFLTYLSGTKNLHIDKSEMTKKLCIIIKMTTSTYYWCATRCGRVKFSTNHICIPGQKKREPERRSISVKWAPRRPAPGDRLGKCVRCCPCMLCPFTYRDLNRLK